MEFQLFVRQQFLSQDSLVLFRMAALLNFTRCRRAGQSCTCEEAPFAPSKEQVHKEILPLMEGKDVLIAIYAHAHHIWVPELDLWGVLLTYDDTIDLTYLSLSLFKL